MALVRETGGGRIWLAPWSYPNLIFSDPRAKYFPLANQQSSWERQRLGASDPLGKVRQDQAHAVLVSNLICRYPLLSFP